MTIDILNIVVQICCFVFGVTVGYRLKQKTYDQLLGDYNNFVNEKVKNLIISVSIKKVNDIYYAYNCKTTEFMSQARSLEELATNLTNLHPANIITTLTIDE